MVMESSGGIQTVVPGSQDDPFSTANPLNATVGDEGIVAGPGVTMTPNAPASTPNPTPTPTGTPAPASVPAPEGAKAPTQKEIDALVGEKLKVLQSGWDRRNGALEKSIKDLKSELQTERDRGRDALRTAQLEGQPEHVKQQLREQWSVEDERTKLQSTRAELMDYHKAVEGLRLLQAYAVYGVTEEELLAAESIEAMEQIAKDKKIEFLEAGGTAPSKGAVAPKATPGANAGPDIGGQPPVAAPPGLLTSQSVDSMEANIKTLFGNGPNVPW